VETAIQEDVNCIGYRIMDREPLVVVSRLMELLTKRGRPHIRVVVGGIIPRQEIPRLKALGVEAVFRLGASLDDIVAQVIGTATG
jgi:methylmalonyl-CoA mutase C-terminal domain/subunit